MGRHPRVAVAGFHHITCRGNNGRTLFFDDHDRNVVFWLLARVLRRLLWKCHSYCLMTNHYHLLLETPDESLPQGMQRLNLGFAQFFNGRYGTTGHVFEAPYKSRHVTRQSHALMAIRYIALNPVEAGLCSRPEDWPWSSYGAVLGIRRPPEWLTTRWTLELFADDLGIARQRLAEFVKRDQVP